MDERATQSTTAAAEESAGGRPAVELELGDGSRLVLDNADASPIICRLEDTPERISLDDAMQLSGQPFAGFKLLR